MNMLRIFGLGNKRILKNNHYTSTTITKVTKCWWIKINRKAVRISGSEGSEYPHMITFSYAVDGVTYSGKRFISPGAMPPHIGNTILIYYNEAEPREYAVEM